MLAKIRGPRRTERIVCSSFINTVPINFSPIGRCIHRNVVVQTLRDTHLLTRTILTAKARTVDDDAAAVETRKGNGCTVGMRPGLPLNLAHGALRKRTREAHRPRIAARNGGKDEADNFSAVDC